MARKQKDADPITGLDNDTQYKLLKNREQLWLLDENHDFDSEAFRLFWDHNADIFNVNTIASHTPWSAQYFRRNVVDKMDCVDRIGSGKDRIYVSCVASVEAYVEQRVATQSQRKRAQAMRETRSNAFQVNSGAL